VYASSDNSIVVIAVKGTTAAFLGGGGGTSTRDKINVSEALSSFPTVTSFMVPSHQRNDICDRNRTTDSFHAAAPVWIEHGALSATVIRVEMNATKHV
jgi:putative lipase involved disintegration of autophagic bodies